MNWAVRIEIFAAGVSGNLSSTRVVDWYQRRLIH